MNTIRKALAVGSALLCLAAAPALIQDGAQDKAGAAEKARKLLELTKADEMGKQVMEHMLEQLSKMPGLPRDFANEFKLLANAAELNGLLVPIYTKHLAEKDLDAVIAFFGTPSGKAWVAAQPAIVKESIVVGQKWGKELAQRTLQSLKNK